MNSEKIGTYPEYARRAIENFVNREPARRNVLVDSLGERRIDAVLDLGCGPGQELLPFLEKTDAHCVGVDIAEEVGKFAGELVGSFVSAGRASFVRSRGEELPFADGAFDVVLCRVALPYMDNRRAIGEVARVLKPDGVFLLKTHNWRFMLSMLLERLKTGKPRMIAYPLICLAGGAWNLLTGRQPTEGFWKGKEVYHTKAYLVRELDRAGLEIDGKLPDSIASAPSYRIVRKGLRLVLCAALLSDYAAALS